MASSGKRDPAGGNDGGNDWAIKRAWSITLELSTPMLGTLVFITSEIFFFGSLIVSFLYFRSRSVSGPGPHQVLDLVYTAIFSVALFASSGTIALADRRLRLCTALRRSHRYRDQYLHVGVFHGHGLPWRSRCHRIIALSVLS